MLVLNSIALVLIRHMCNLTIACTCPLLRNSSTMSSCYILVPRHRTNGSPTAKIVASAREVSAAASRFSAHARHFCRSVESWSVDRSTMLQQSAVAQERIVISVQETSPLEDIISSTCHFDLLSRRFSTKSLPIVSPGDTRR